VHLLTPAFPEGPNDEDKTNTHGTNHQSTHELHGGTVNPINARNPDEVQVEDQHLPGTKPNPGIASPKKSNNSTKAATICN